MANDEITTPKALAARLVSIAKNVKEKFMKIFSREESDVRLSRLLSHYKASMKFAKNEEEFFDTFARVITYGYFAFRLLHDQSISMDDENDFFLGPVPYLSFYFDRLDEMGAGGLQDLLQHPGIEGIMDQYGREKQVKDPILHFYEEFLHEYDKEKKNELGVFYTPDPVVSFIVRSVRTLLEREFGFKGGFASKNLLKRANHPVPPTFSMLDPAAGTGTFLLHLMDQHYQDFYTLHEDATSKETLDEKWSDFMIHSGLWRIKGFEVMPEPWMLGRLKMILKLQEMGLQLEDDESINFYRRDGLAKYPKKDRVNIILGNPPYRGESTNKNEWIDALMRGNAEEDRAKRSYFEIGGMPLGEKNPKWINDDYVKFFRVAQWLVDRAGWGMVAFITNHNYLDTVTFRGMRESLLNGFSSVYILDLHGNARRKETCPDGSKDENVFDSIQQGTCISILVKQLEEREHAKARVFHKDTWGSRKAKFEFLEANDVSTIEWKEIEPSWPWYMFKDVDDDNWKEYEKGWPINEIFPTSSICIITARDRFTIKRTREEVQETVREFLSMEPEEAREHFGLGKDARDWKVELAMEDLRESGQKEGSILRILYRPFDWRYTYYTGRSRGFHCMPRGEVMDSMKMPGNVGLLTRRQMLPNRPCNYFFVAGGLVSDGVIRSDNKGGESVYPLYTFTEGGKRQANVEPEILETLATRYGREVAPEEVFYYAYALFHSQDYRERFAEFLRRDYPRVLFPDDTGELERMETLGKKLVELHLGNAKLETAIEFKGEGPREIQKPRFKDGKVFINGTRYFEPVAEEAWNFYIGTYKVLEKWLKSRKGEDMDANAAGEFMQTCEIISATINLMERIDARSR